MTTHLDYVTGRFVLSEHLVPAGNQQFYHIYDGDFILGETLVPGLGKNLFLDASLDLNFAKNLSLVDDVSGNNLVSFSRASSGTHVDSDGLIKTSPVNLVKYSEQLDQSSWSKTSGTSVVPNTVTAPDGTNTASTVDLPASNSRFNQEVTVGSGVFTLSAYLRIASGSKQLTMQAYNATDGSQNKDITVTSEWQRFSHTVTVSNTFTQWHPVRPGSSDLGEVYIWGAQLEEGDELTEYTPSVDTFVSRASSATYVDDATGLIKTTPVNLYLQSENLTNAYWTKSNSSASTNAAIAPGSVSQVFKLVSNNFVSGNIIRLMSGLDLSLIHI